MNKINFKNGYHLDTQSMNFLQEAYTKPLEALIQSSKAEYFVISGAELTYELNDDQSELIVKISDGWIVKNGDIMEFRGRTLESAEILDGLYVVFRTEYLPNTNADGSLDSQAMVRRFATLGQDEDGAIPYDMFVKKKMMSLVCADDISSDIETEKTFDRADDVEPYGFYTVNMAKPRFRISRQQVALFGAFKVQNTSQTGGVKIKLGKISNWVYGGVGEIKCLIYPDANDTGFISSAEISISGDIYINYQSQFLDKIFAVTFDGTPYNIF